MAYPGAKCCPLLRELAEELQDARVDGTMPGVLSPEQVWIEPDGQVQLIDILDGIGLEGEAERQSEAEE